MGKRGPHQPPRAERFWMRVDRDGPVPEHVPHLGQCWLWTGPTLKLRGGYGHFYDDDCRLRRAHRVAWEIATGTVLTPDEHVLHRCDEPRCVRKSHLFLGDQVANMLDMWGKDRGKVPVPERGTQRYNAKLTDDRVRTLRALRASGGNVKALAAEWGITQACASAAATGRSWKHVV